jgi:hypothetical protein
MCAILLDTKGPEIRTGKLKDGKEIELVAGQVSNLNKHTMDRCSQDFLRVLKCGWIYLSGIQARQRLRPNWRQHTGQAPLPCMWTIFYQLDSVLSLCRMLMTLVAEQQVGHSYKDLSKFVEVGGMVRVPSSISCFELGSVGGPCKRPRISARTQHT